MQEKKTAGRVSPEAAFHNAILYKTRRSENTRLRRELRRRTVSFSQLLSL